MTSSSPIHLLICDYAAVHPDGSCTIVRGGIERVASANLPVNLLLWLLVEVEPDALPVGTHGVRISVRTTEQDVEIFDVDGHLTVTDSSARSRFALPVTCSVQAFGAIRMHALVGALSSHRTVIVEALQGADS